MPVECLEYSEPARGTRKANRKSLALGKAFEPNPDRAMSVGAALEREQSVGYTQTDVEPEYEVRSIQTQTRLHAVAASDAEATSSVVDARAPAERVSVSAATWLILPVVICLSQRLSHACLSTNFYTVKLRMAH